MQKGHAAAESACCNLLRQHGRKRLLDVAVVAAKKGLVQNIPGFIQLVIQLAARVANHFAIFLYLKLFRFFETQC